MLNLKPTDIKSRLDFAMWIEKQSQESVDMSVLWVFSSARYLRDRYYTDNRDGIKELKTNINREIRQISSETCKAVIRNFRTRVFKVIQEKGKRLR
jgi:hypothetical protein